MLEKEGYEVAIAHTGEQALKLVESSRPDGILLDLMLPGISGIDVLKHLRAQQLYEKIVVIVLTARPLEETPLEIIQLGANTHCSKPIAPSTLFRTLLEFGLPVTTSICLPQETENDLKYASI